MLFAISIVPVFGQIAAHFLVPIFGAGMVQICRQISEDKEPQIADLFVGFRHNAGPLVMVGVFFSRYLWHCFPLPFIGEWRRPGGVITGRVGGFGRLWRVMLAGLIVMVLSVPVIMANGLRRLWSIFSDMKPAATNAGEL